MAIESTERILRVSRLLNPQTWWVVIAGATLVVGMLTIALGLKGLALGLASVAAVLIVTAIIRFPWFGIAAIAFSLPFERFGALEISGFTLRVSQILLGITLVIVVGYILKGDMRLRFRGEHIPLLVFLFGAVIAMSQAVNEFRAWTTLLFMCATALLVFLIPTVIRSKQQMTKIAQALLIGAIFSSIFGIFQFIGDLAGLPTEITGLRDLYTKEVFGFPRIQSTALEPLYFANYLLLPLGLAFVSLVKRIRPLMTLSAIFVPIALPVFVLTLSRAAYLAGVVLVAVICVWLFRKIIKPSYLFLAIVVAAVTFFGVTYGLSLTGDSETSVSAFTRQATGLFTGASFADRVGTSQDALALIPRNPLGVGPGNFGPRIAAHPLIEPEGGWLIVNNIYLEVLVEEGVLGFIGLAGFVVFVIVSLFRAYKKTDDPFVQTMIIGTTAALIAILAQYTTFSILYIMHIWFAFGIAIASIRLAYDGTHPTSSR